MHNANTSTRNRLPSLAVAGGIGVLALWAAIDRRWMSDDGLIVLRTVRNLLEGNGPVFNVGERVEANTSTLWQYLIVVGHWLSGGGSLAAVATWLAIILSTAAMAIGAWATATTFGRPEQFRGGRHSMPAVAPVRPWLLPAGALVYLALPPARDFFTSGLEWGLSIFYLAVLWWLLTRWAQRAEVFARGDERRAALDAGALLLAFWAGLSWLVRPELALYGGITGIVLFIAHRNWRSWLAILAVALPLPAGYQIFRMGYYGLLTPHTAVAKSASGSAWGSGFAYLGDFVGPYWLWLPLLILAGLALGLTLARVVNPAERAVRSQFTAAAIMVGCALLHFVYVLRVGGDFMHGRMLLLPLFAVLLPVFVLPLKSMAVAVGTGLIALWALIVAWRGHQVDWAEFEEPDFTVVDEREYWTYVTGREPDNPPKNEVDFQKMRLLRGFDNGLEGLAAGDAMAFTYREDPNDKWSVNWLSTARDPERTDPPTLYLINLGMSSMNAPLDVRVLDTIGLATPLAARQPRIEDGRIGHDKSLDLVWRAADSAVAIEALPEWLDKEAVARARQALEAPEFQELFATYRDPLTVERFFGNMKWALTDGRTLQLSGDPEFYLK